MPKEKIEIKSKIQANVESRIETLDNITYEVFHGISIVEGVLNLLLYPADEIKESVMAWNGVPVTYRHPEKDGKFVSADSSPEISEQFNFGRIMNSYISQKKDGRTYLANEFWIDIRKAEANPEMNERLEQMRKTDGEVEVSTGLFITYDMQEGTFTMPDGEERPYLAIARSYVPNHIAILEAGVPGASSCKDGAGIRTNQIINGDYIMTNLAIIKTNEISDLDVRAQIAGQVREKFGSADDYAWLDQVYQDSKTFVFEAEGKFWLGSYEMADDVITISDDKIEVIGKTEWTEVSESESNSADKSETETQNKSKTINTGKESNSTSEIKSNNGEDTMTDKVENTFDPAKEAVISNEDLAVFNALKAEKEARVNKLREKVSAMNEAYKDAVANMDETALNAIISANEAAENKKKEEMEEKDKMEDNSDKDFKPNYSTGDEAPEGNGTGEGNGASNSKAPVDVFTNAENFKAMEKFTK